MKVLHYLLVIIVFLFFSCTNKKPAVLNTSNLKTDRISIDAGKEYKLQTPKGAIIKIAANSFDVPAGSTVDIDIKEAYSMQDILAAGLTTESNGQPLWSGGMIYINATVNGKEVKLIKPVKISIPTEVYDDRMLVYKGVIEEDSSINWVEPVPMDSGIKGKELALGGQLFKSNCANCHKPAEDATGPALAKCRLRAPNAEWAYEFTNNTNWMLERDSYARSLLKKFGSKMTQFNLPYRDIKAIFDYCDNEAGLNPNYRLPDKAPGTSVPNEPCGFDTIYLPKPPEEIIAVENTNTADTVIVPMTQNNGFADPESTEPESTEGLRKGFTDTNPTGGMYDFSIQTLGWYNIDFAVKGYAQTSYVEVNVLLNMPEDLNMGVYLFYPDKKMLSVGSPVNKNEFHFDKVDGKIPLYLNSNVVVLAFGSKSDRMYYGTASFRVKEKQQVSIEVKQTTEDTFKAFIRENNIDGIKIGVDKKEEYKIYNKNCDSANDTTVVAAKNK